MIPVVIGNPTSLTIRKRTPDHRIPPSGCVHLRVFGQESHGGGDGRVLDVSGRNLWQEYMEGATPVGLAFNVEQMLSIG
jgi:hypothetical protein